MIDRRFKLISDIYDLPLQPERWVGVFDDFAREIGAAGVTLQVFDPLHEMHRMEIVSSIFHSISEDSVAIYEKKYKQSDSAVYQALEKCRDSELRADFELSGIEEKDRDNAMPAVGWMRNNFNVDHRAACRLSLHGAWSDIFALQFSAERGAITSEEKAWAGFFIPHWSRVVEMHRTFHALKSRFDAVLGVLDRLHVGICLLSGYGEVVLVNEEARRIADLNDGFSIDKGGVPKAGVNRERGYLPQAIDGALRTAKGTGAFIPLPFAVQRRSGGDPFLIEVMPLRDGNCKLDAGFSGALLLIIDPMKTDVISTEGMAKIYQLTGAESEICRMLAIGMETDDVADARNISRETVRTHVKRILDKTGTKNRVQLVRLAHKVNLPVK